MVKQEPTQELALLPKKELAQFKGTISSIGQQAQAVEIKDQKSLEAATDILHTIKEAKNAILARKEEITRPLMASLASARDLFKLFETAFSEAEKIVKNKMLGYQTAEDERIEKEKASIAKKVDAGRMKGETAIAKLENLGETPTSASGSTGSIATRTLTKVRIVDEALIPREYLVPDMNKITEDVIRKGVLVPGVEKYTEKVIVGK